MTIEGVKRIRGRPTIIWRKVFIKDLTNKVLEIHADLVKNIAEWKPSIYTCVGDINELGIRLVVIHTFI